MRIRQVKPDFWKHDGLGEVSRDARLLFIGLWALADCDGRLDDRPKKIKAEIFPYDDLNAEDINTLLNELLNHPEKFITRYSLGEDRFIQITNFDKHQHLMGNEAKQKQRGGGSRPNPDSEGVTLGSQLVRTDIYPVLTSTTDIRSNGYTDKRNNGSSCRSNSRCTDEQKSVAVFILEKIKTIHPGQKEPNLDAWGNEIRLMVERDGRSLEAIKELFVWANKDPFWRANILSPAKLREKWDQLYIKKTTPRVPAGGPVAPQITPSEARKGGVVGWD